MKRGFLFASLLSAISAAAAADVTVTVNSEGYNDFFKRCDITVKTERDAGLADATVIYRILGGDKGVQMCARLSNSGGCRGELEEHDCDDVTGVDIYGVTCEAADGSNTDCGAVTVKAGDSLSVPVNVLPPAAPADTTVYALIGGFDDFFDRCGMGFMFTSKPEITHVDLEFNVSHSGGVAECNYNLANHYGTGSSCLGEEEFTCDAVDALNITKITCQDEAGEADCGTINFSSAEAGLIRDAR